MSSALIIITVFFLFSIYLAIRAKKGKRWTMKGGLSVVVVMVHC